MWECVCMFMHLCVGGVRSQLTSDIIPQALFTLFLETASLPRTWGSGLTLQ